MPGRIESIRSNAFMDATQTLLNDVFRVDLSFGLGIFNSILVEVYRDSYEYRTAQADK